MDTTFQKCGFMSPLDRLLDLNASLRNYTADKRPILSIELDFNTYYKLLEEVLPSRSTVGIDNFILYGIRIKCKKRVTENSKKVKGPREP